MSQSLNSLILRNSPAGPYDLSREMMLPVNYRPSLFKKRGPAFSDPKGEPCLPPLRSVVGDFMPPKNYPTVLSSTFERSEPQMPIIQDPKPFSVPSFDPTFFSDPGRNSPYQPSTQKLNEEVQMEDSMDTEPSAPTTDYQGRYCHVCKVTSTPRWRRGPRGRQTLCNSCGLKYIRKKKKEMKLNQG